MGGTHTDIQTDRHRQIDINEETYKIISVIKADRHTLTPSLIFRPEFSSFFSLYFHDPTPANTLQVAF